MDMSVNIAGVEWKNPVTVASGTFGSGAEFADYVDINKLGAVTTKGVANVPWAGNPLLILSRITGSINPNGRKPITFPKRFVTTAISPSCFLYTQKRLISTNGIRLYLYCLSSIAALPYSSEKNRK